MDKPKFIINVKQYIYLLLANSLKKGLILVICDIKFNAC